MFGELSAVTVAKLLEQSQKQLDKLQSKASGTVTDNAKVAALQAQIQVLNGGGTTAQAKAAYHDVQTKTVAASKPPIIPAMPDVPDAPDVNYRPWLIGGAAVVGGLVILTLIMSLTGKKSGGNEPK